MYRSGKMKVLSVLVIVFLYCLTNICFCFDAKAEEMTANSIKKKMDQICTQYGFSGGKYWSYNQTEGSPTAYEASTHKANTSSSTNHVDAKGNPDPRPGENGWYGYKFDSGSECWAFASFIGYKLFGQKNPQNGGWVKYTTAAQVREHGLCVGDIIRTSGHSAIVYSIKADGEIDVLQCYGTQYNLIPKTKLFCGFDTCKTIDDILNNKGKRNVGKFVFVAHASNNTSKPIWPESAAIKNIFTLPANLKRIEDEAFINTNADRIVIPATVTSIGDSAFDKVQISGYKGSEAENYAKDHKYTFIPITK